MTSTSKEDQIPNMLFDYPEFQLLVAHPIQEEEQGDDMQRPMKIWNIRGWGRDGDPDVGPSRGRGDKGNDMGLD